MKRQHLRFTSLEKRQKENAILNTAHPSSSGRKSPPELFTHNSTLTDTKQPRRSSPSAQPIALLVRCAFVILLGVMALGTVNILHALPVSERTPQVRDAIVAAVRGVNSATDVTEAHLAAITFLNLSQKSITSLKIGDFEGITALQVLRLEGNDLTSLPSGIFDNNTALQGLWLSSNGLTSLPADIFDNNTALQIFNLFGNGLTSLPSGIFDNNTALYQLNLEGNGLTSLPADIFDNNTALRLLNLSSNGLTSLPSGIFDNNTALIQLNLISNGLTSLPSDIFDNNTALSELNLFGNGLTSLPSGIFDNNAALTQLRLFRNGLTSLPSGIFDNNTALIQLRLDGNGLTSLPSGIFDNNTALQELNLSGNGLTSLPAGIFDNNTALQELNLSGNGLTSLPAGIFEGLTSLTRLYLANDAVDPLSLTVSLDKVGVNEFKAVAPPGAPFDIVLPFSITNGSISSSATNITISKGSVESNTLTVERAPGTTAAVTVDIGTLPRLPSHHFGYRLVKSDDLPLTFTNLGPVFTPVCARTPQVRDAIVAAVPGVSNCNNVTEAHLAAITRLSLSWNVSREKITSLKADDFSGLSSLEILWLSHNSLTSLPEGIFDGLSSLEAIDLLYNNINSIPSNMFDGLTSLKGLDLQGNRLTSISTEWFDDLSSLERLSLRSNSLTSLPMDVFDKLTSMKDLNLGSNSLTNLPAEVFDELSSLTHLSLRNNSLTNLPADIFEGLSPLIWLDIGYNSLTSLPEGIFNGLSSLTTLTLSGNTVDPLPLTVSLEKVGTDQLKAVAPTGAPFDIVLPLSVTNGSISGGATNITISKGSVESQALTVARTSGTTAAVTVDIGALPGLPSGHQGYQLAKPANLPLEIISVRANRAPVFTYGTNATRSVAENTVSGLHIGTPVSAIDADNDTLTYTLGGTDAASFGINSSTGQLQTKASLDYETKSTYTVTVGVSDGTLTDAITVTINITDVNETPANRAPIFTDGATTTRSIAENTATGVNIGTAITATDADNDTLTYTHGGTDAASFGISSSTGQLKTKAALDYETKSTYTVTITVSDGSLADTITVTINITDVAETPTTGVTPPEVCQAGDVLAPGESCTYPDTNTEFSVLSDGRGQFGFFTSGSSLNIKNTVINGQPYTLVANKLANGSWKIEEIADSAATPGTTNTAPTFTDGTSTTRTVAENTGAGVNIGTPVTATDADNDTLTYTLGGPDGASFVIDATTGQLKTKAALDYETRRSYTVTATVSDGSLTDIITVTINITDVDETPANRAPVFTDGATTTRSIAENTATGVNIGTAIAATDVDNDTLTYTLGGTDAASFGISSSTGQLKTKAALDYETKSTYTVTITVSDGTLTDAITATINITDINETPANRAPVFTEGASTTRTVELPPKPENPGDMDIGAPLFATDADGDTLTYTLGGADAALFHTYAFLTYLHYTTPGVQLTTRGGSLYDGTKSSYTVTVTASDGSLTDTITVTINVTDVAETPTTGVTAPGACQVGDVLAPGESCTYPDTNTEFSVLSDGRGQFGFFTSGSSLNIKNTVINGQPYTLVANKLASGSWKIEEIADSAATPGTTNTAPTFTDGASTTRSIAENTASGQHIGTPVVATDANNDTLTYTLGGTDAASFGIDATTGQLKTKAALDYETKRSYTVTATVSDGNLTDTITVTITVTDVDESPTNTAQDYIQGPWLWMIAEGSDIDTDYLAVESNGTITETQVAQNGVNEGDNLGDLQWTRGRIYPSTHTSFWGIRYSDNVNDVVNAIGLTTDQNLNHHSAYALINIISTHDQNNIQMGVGSDDAVKVWLNGTVVHKNNVSRRTSGIQDRFRVNLKAGNNLLLVKVSENWDNWGMFFKIYLDEADFTTAIPKADTDGQLPDTLQPPVTTNSAPVFTDGASTTRSIAENTATGVHIGSAVTATDPDNDTLTYILGGTNAAAFNIDATTGQLKTKAALDYETKRSYTVTVTVSDGSLTDSITITINVTDVAETPTPQQPQQPQQPAGAGGTPTLRASTTSPLTEATLNESIVTLTLSGGTYERSSSRIRIAVTVSGISGVTVQGFDIDRVSDTEVTIELTFDGNINTDSVLTFTVDSWAIAGYDGAALTALIPVTGGTESIVASTTTPLTEATLDESLVTLTLSGRTFERFNSRIRGAVSVSGISGVTVRSFDIDRVNDTQVTVELTFSGNISTDSTLTFTVGPGAIADYDGAALTAQVSVTASTEAPTVTNPPQQPQQPQQPVGGTPTLRASTTAPLTEATLNESVVTLTLSGGTYVDSSFSVARAITVSGIDGITFNTWDVDDISDTEVTVELTFNGDFDTNATLTFTMGAGAIADYDGTAIAAQIPVTGGTESLVASTAAPLTEATLHESVVTLTLSGRTYVDSSFSVARAITVSGIDGVTFNTWDVDRISDTVVIVELTFNGDFDTNATLTFTVGAGAIAGLALTAQVPVTGGTESLVASTDAPLTEATLHESVVTLTLSGRQFADEWVIGNAITVSGIDGVTFNTWDVDRISDTVVTVELTFDGNFDTDATLTFTVGADAIAGYNGPVLTAQVSVTATQGVLRAPSGISLIHVPLRVTTVNGLAQTIESVGDLYDALGGAEAVNLLTIYDSDTQSWLSYLGEYSRGTAADTVLADHQGVIADMKTSVSLQLDGDALGSNGSSFITLHPGTNLVGVPLRDSRITHISDLLALEGIEGNVSTITLLNNGAFQSVGRAADAGDIPITGGQSFILNAREAATVAISGQGWDSVSGAAAAAPVGLMGIDVGNSTPVLALTGSIVSAVDGWGNRMRHLRPGSGFRVIVKNLSTRKSVATTTGETGAGYQLTVVDTETARAAQVGDILEISVRSPDPRIGVQPLRHTIVVEDVKRSRIELDNLIVYEIPTETQLLPNYPNPFNPETWIPHRLAEDAFVTLTIYDSAGRVVRTLEVGHRVAAFYESRSKAIYWDGRNEFGEQVASGVYFYHLSTGDYSATRKMLIAK